MSVTTLMMASQLQKTEEYLNQLLLLGIKKTFSQHCWKPRSNAGKKTSANSF
jgi:hypothetical protein